METLRWLGWMYARLVALAVTIASAWVFLVNAGGRSYQGWILAWILVSGVVGMVGGPLYLLSIDGPVRFRGALKRRLGWAAMLAAMLLPSSISFFLLPMVLTLVPTLVRVRGEREALKSS